MQFHGKVQKSLVKSQRSSAITCSLQESEHMNISREDTGLLESKTCCTFYCQATDAGNRPIPISVSPFSYRMLKTRDQPCTTPLTSVLGTNKADTRNSALWNTATSGRASRGHQTNSGYPKSAPCLQTGAHTARAWTSGMHVPKTFFCWCSTRHGWSGSRTLRTAAELFCWALSWSSGLHYLKASEMQGWQSV